MLTSLFIENVSLRDIIDGNHIDCDSRPTVLIQIIDHEMDAYPTPKHLSKFSDVYQFQFDDTEDVFDVNCITDSQAATIANILRESYTKRKNIVVHCHAGICRSGGVVECGVALGYLDVEHRQRIPNVLVKRKILQCLSLLITKETSVFND